MGLGGILALADPDDGRVGAGLRHHRQLAHHQIPRPALPGELRRDVDDVRHPGDLPGLIHPAAVPISDQAQPDDAHRGDLPIRLPRLRDGAAGGLALQLRVHGGDCAVGQLHLQPGGSHVYGYGVIGMKSPISVIEDVHNTLYWFKNNAKYIGIGKKCPVCNNRLREFAPAGVNKRADAKCIWCGSLERHRLIWLFFQRKTDLFDGHPKKMLHFAPEKAFVKTFSKYIGAGYTTVDLYNDAMVKIDMTAIAFKNDAFDVVYCCHVFEHIIDDVQAIKELSRVLNSTGWALIVVPINAELTFEDPNIIEPEDRLRIFGQEDHVRICGSDYSNRLEINGLNVLAYITDAIANEQEKQYFGLKDATLYLCTKKLQIA